MNIMKATQYFCHSPFYFNQKKNNKADESAENIFWRGSLLQIFDLQWLLWFLITFTLKGICLEVCLEYYEFFSVCMWCFRYDEAPIFNEAGIAFCPLMLIILFLKIYREWNIYDLTFSLIRLVDLISAIWLSNLSSHVWWIDEIVIWATIREFTSE